jgi:hypothetical protein
VALIRDTVLSFIVNSVNGADDLVALKLFSTHDNLGWRVIPMRSLLNSAFNFAHGSLLDSLAN